MSTMEINKPDYDEDKSPDKKQIEAEEMEVMLKTESDYIEAATDAKTDGEGVVKAALSGDVTEQGREVKPKFIPIGAIKMPGFFTKNSDKDKSEDEDVIEKDPDHKKTEEHKPKIGHRLQFLHSCPLTKFLHHSKKEHAGENGGNKGLFNLKYPKLFQKRSGSSAEAALASMETLDEKLDTPNDGMETVKLDGEEPEDGKVATKLPLKERIRQNKLIIDDIAVCAVVVLVIAVAVIGVLVVACAGPPAERPLRLGRYITTASGCGPVEGIYDEGVYKFFSIPYAEPPVADKRFTYAQPLNNISLCWNGTLQAQQPGPLCVQFLDNGTITGKEDCLTLDIVTPHVRYDSPLPVVVLIGANSLSGGISAAQPSALYARTKEVVFVRPNFRLGPFGFLALDILSDTKYPPTSGNYGLSDLLVALQWVHRNIQHFGGDPDSVTLLGHRAGATLTAALTTVGRAQKLFARAWLSSPSVVFPGEPLERSQRRNERFKQLSKCDDADCLRAMTTTEILSATPDVWLGSTVGTLPPAGAEPERSWLVLDGDLLRMHAYESWDLQMRTERTGKDKAFKPMVFGTTQHADLQRQKHVNWTAEIVERAVKESALGEKNLTAGVFSYVERSYAGLAELAAALRTLCPLVSLARLRLRAPLYVVPRLASPSGRAPAPAPADADVRAALGSLAAEQPEQRRFMAAMQQLFYYFVWHGRLAGAGAAGALLAVGQDVAPLAEGLPLCDLLIREDMVPRYAHVD